MKKKIFALLSLVALLMASGVSETEASRWEQQGPPHTVINGTQSCITTYYTCVSGFGFAFCEVGSTKTVTVCSGSSPAPKTQVY